MRYIINYHLLLLRSANIIHILHKRDFWRNVARLKVNDMKLGKLAIKCAQLTRCLKFWLVSQFLTQSSFFSKNCWIWKEMHAYPGLKTPLNIVEAFYSTHKSSLSLNFCGHKSKAQSQKPYFLWLLWLSHTFVPMYVTGFQRVVWHLWHLTCPKVSKNIFVPLVRSLRDT